MPSLRSSTGSGQGTGSGMFGRWLEASTQLGYMVKGIAGLFLFLRDNSYYSLKPDPKKLKKILSITDSAGNILVHSSS